NGRVLSFLCIFVLSVRCMVSTAPSCGASANTASTCTAISSDSKCNNCSSTVPYATASGTSGIEAWCLSVPSPHLRWHQWVGVEGELIFTV
uniref:Secreted protein n=1 Tax=Castor canadensis TaxID=51338 RepID=A0A8C0W7N3_CASCN